MHEVHAQGVPISASILDKNTTKYFCKPALLLPSSSRLLLMFTPSSNRLPAQKGVKSCDTVTKMESAAHLSHAYLAKVLRVCSAAARQKIVQGIEEESTGCKPCFTLTTHPHCPSLLRARFLPNRQFGAWNANNEALMGTATALAWTLTVTTKKFPSGRLTAPIWVITSAVKFTPGCPGPPCASLALKLSMQAKQTSPIQPFDVRWADGAVGKVLRNELGMSLLRSCNAHSIAVLMMHPCLHMHHGMLQCCQRGFANFSASLTTLPSLVLRGNPAQGDVGTPLNYLRLQLFTHTVPKTTPKHAMVYMHAASCVAIAALREFCKAESKKANENCCQLLPTYLLLGLNQAGHAPDPQHPQSIRVGVTLSPRAGVELGRPCTPSSAQLPNKEVSERIAYGLLCPADDAGLPSIVSLGWTSSSGAGGALGGPGQPGVKFTGYQANLGALAP
eukprot:1136619-Pelagomonas_calceolata.AAC.7